MIRLLKGAGGQVSLLITSAGDQPKDATGNVTITIKDGAGATVVGPVNATKRSGKTGIYDYQVSAAHSSLLDTYTDVWAATVDADAKTYTTRHEVVGAFLFSIAELRALDSELDDETKYPTPKLVDARERAEEVFETECGISFRPRGARLNLRGNDHNLILLTQPDGSPVWNPLRIVSASIDGVALTAAEIAATKLHAWGALQRPAYSYWTAGDIVLHVEHGMSAVSATVAAEAAKLALHYVRPTAIPDRADSVSTGDETFRLSSSPDAGPTPVPSVNRLIAFLKRDVPAVG